MEYAQDKVMNHKWKFWAKQGQFLYSQSPFHWVALRRDKDDLHIVDENWKPWIEFTSYTVYTHVHTARPSQHGGGAAHIGKAGGGEGRWLMQSPRELQYPEVPSWPGSYMWVRPGWRGPITLQRKVLFPASHTPPRPCFNLGTDSGSPRVTSLAFCLGWTSEPCPGALPIKPSLSQTF